MKATFFQRLGAYLIDMIFIIFILGLMTSGISSKKVTNLQEKSNKLYNDVLKEKITTDEYAKEYIDLTYKIQKTSAVSNTINIILIVVYFVGFQYFNNGQTLGKKVLKIKVVNDNKKGATILQLLIRGLFIYGICSGVMNILLLTGLSKSLYMPFYFIFGFIETILMLLCSFFVLYRNDKRGLHDIASKTIVIKE